MWIENDEAFATVDVANACYALMLQVAGVFVHAGKAGAAEGA